MLDRVWKGVLWLIKVSGTEQYVRSPGLMNGSLLLSKGSLLTETISHYRRYLSSPKTHLHDPPAVVSGSDAVTRREMISTDNTPACPHVGARSFIQLLTLTFLYFREWFQFHNKGCSLSFSFRFGSDRTMVSLYHFFCYIQTKTCSSNICLACILCSSKFLK